MSHSHARDNVKKQKNIFGGSHIQFTVNFKVMFVFCKRLVRKYFILE